jgi:nudix-type nucleoside diphosphatase (YffH/AdpP family)
MNIIKRENVYNGYSKLEKLTLEHPVTKKQFTRELLKRGSSVTFLLYDTENNLFMSASEFRTGESHLRSRSYGLVAGMIEDGLDFAATAVKEAEEESGLIVDKKDVRFLSKTFVSPGITDEQSTLCYADVDLSGIDTSKKYGCDSENEEIIVSLHSLDDLDNFISRNDLSTSAFALLFLLLQKALP